MAKDGEVATSFQSLSVRVMRFLGRYLSEMADAMIEVNLKMRDFVDIPPQSKIVFPLHGIRTQARWQRTFAEIAQSAGWQCRLSKWFFGWFSLFQCFSPWSREAKVCWLRTAYHEEVQFARLPSQDGIYPDH
jgi:hypothetical protein